MSSGYQAFPSSGVANWKLPVATAASLPASGNNLGDARAVEDSGVIYVWTGSSWTAPSGAGTVTSVDCSVPNFLSVSGTPITGAGTIAIALATQVKNKVFAGPTTGADAAPTFRLLVGADLPLPAVATLGGVFSKAAVSHNFLTSISSVDGSIGQAQPAFTDISGSVAAAQLPNPSASSLGGVQSIAAVSHNFLTSISTSGVPAQAQPAFSDISGSVAASQLPNPSASTLGGVQSAASVSHQWIDSISTSGVPHLSQPVVADITGAAPLASPAFTGQVTFGNYHMEPSENNAGNSGTSLTVDLSTGAAQKITLTGNVTLTLTNPVTGGSYVFKIATGAGSFTVTWPASVKWSGGTAPTITTAASKVDLINLYWDGTNYFGSFVQNF